MILKHFLLYGEEGISEVTKSFSFQTRCITSLYERLFVKNYTTEDCKQLNFHCGNYCEMKLLDNVDGFYDIAVPYDTNTFLSLNDNEKSIEALELLKSSLDFIIREKQWYDSPFNDAYLQVKKQNYINKFIWSKPKWNNSRTHKAEVHCTHNLYNFIINIIIKDKNNNIILNNKLISCKPDEIIYKRYLGELKWINETQVCLFEINKKRYFLVSL